MKIIKINEKNVIPETISVLNSGGLVIYPTETCYGVGVDAGNPEAVTKLLEYKKRPEGKAISVAVNSKEMAEKYVNLNKSAENIYKNFLPGAITVVSKSKKVLDSRLASEKETLGIRIPNYKFLHDLISEFNRPITSTSANSSGKKTPYSVSDILENLSKKQKDLIDLIIDAGELPHNPPSTVIDTTTEELTVYRQGRIDPRRITNYERRITRNVGETIDFAEKLMGSLINKLNEHPGVFLLNGELGAGKTHFVKGIAKALGITQIIKSPTYTYVSEYPFSMKYEVGSMKSGPTSGFLLQASCRLYHLDAWRIQSIDDLHVLKFKEWLKPGNVIAIEWPSVIMNLDEKIFDGIEYVYVDFIIKNSDDREIKVYFL